MAIRAERLKDHPDDDRSDQSGDEPGRAGEAELLGDPAADDRTEDPDDDVRQAATRGPAADQRTRDRPGDEPDDDPVQRIHRGQSATSGSGRKASIAATNIAACVWWAACRAPPIV